MSDAKKCDRCGAYYERVGYKDICVCRVDKYGIRYTQDYCDKCVEELKQFDNVYRTVNND